MPRCPIRVRETFDRFIALCETEADRAMMREIHEYSVGSRHKFGGRATHSSAQHADCICHVWS
eukprot:3023910-Pleurochrysis_carterae.AAC.1